MADLWVAMCRSVPWRTLPINLSTFAWSQEPPQNPLHQSSPCSQKPINQSRYLVGVFVLVLSCQVPELRNRQMARLLGSQQSHNSGNACFHTIFHGRQHITALPCFGSPNLSCPNLPMLISSFKREKQELDSKSYRK